MFWYLFALTVVSILALVGTITYYLYYDGFQNPPNNEDLSGAALLSPDDVDLTGKNLNAIVRDLSGILQGATADRRPVDSGERLCEGFVKQISAMEAALVDYRNSADWSNVGKTEETLTAIRKHQSEAGCQNNNT